LSGQTLRPGVSLEDFLEDAKLKDYVVNSFLPLAPTQRSLMPRICKTKIRNVSDILVTKTEVRMGLWLVGSIDSV